MAGQKIDIKQLELKPNPDLVKERVNGNVDVKKLNLFIHKLIFGSEEKYEKLKTMSNKKMNNRCYKLILMNY